MTNHLYSGLPGARWADEWNRENVDILIRMLEISNYYRVKMHVIFLNYVDLFAKPLRTSLLFSYNS